MWRYAVGFLAVAPLTAFAADGFMRGGWLRGVQETHPSSVALHHDDDVADSYGNTSAAPDCWWEWDTAGTDSMSLICTDVDGGGTDGKVCSVNTGTDDLVFVGNVSTAAGTVSAEQLNSTDDADVNDSLTCGDLVIDEAAGVINFTGATSGTIQSTADLTLSPGGGEVHVGADDSAKNVEVHSGGTFKMWDASDDTSVTLDIDNGTTELDLAGSLNVSTDVTVAGDVKNLDSVLFDSPATDAAATDFTITSQGAFEGVNATNTKGGALCPIPHSGAVNFTGVTRAGTAGDTISFTGYKEDCTTYSVTFTEGVTYTCAAAANDAECVLNLKTAIDANATIGPLTNTYCSDGTCSDERLAVFPTGEALQLTITPSDGTNTARSAGVLGSIKIAAGTGTVPAIEFLDDADGTGTGIVRTGASTLGITANGTVRLSVSPSTIAATIPITNASAALNLGDSASSGHSLATGDVIIGDKLEVDGAAYFDSTMQSTGQTITCADSGDGGASACGGAQTISSSVVTVNCADADGCTLTLAETNWSATATGVVAMVAGTTQTGALSLADSAGVVELEDGTAWTPSAGDAIHLVYDTSALSWAEISRRGAGESQTPWTSTIDADDNDLGDGGTFEVDGLMCTTDNTLTVGLAADTATIKDTTDNATGVFLTLDHDSATSDDDDVIGTLTFKGNDSIDADHVYAKITTEIDSDAHTIERGTMRFYASGPSTPLEYMRLDGGSGTEGAVFSKRVQSEVQTVNCDADCNSPVTLTSNIVVVNCTNAGGCAMTLAETGYSATVSGTVTFIAGATQTGALSLADEANVTELAGGSSWTPTERDTLSLVYSPALYWVETARADNTP